MIRKQWKQLLLTDRVLILYLAVVAIWLAFFHQNVSLWPRYSIGYGGLSVALFVVLPHWKLSEKRVLRFLRISFPALATSVLFVQLNDLLFSFFPDYIDEAFIQMEWWLFGSEPAMELSRLLPWRWFSEMMSFFYVSYYVQVFVTAVLAWRLAPRHFYRIVFGITATFYFCYVIYVIFPVAGPTIPRNISLDDQFTGYIIADFLKFLLARGEVAGAAFPSSHVVLSLLCLFFSLRFLPKWGHISMLIFLGLAMSTVYLKQHYAVDVLGGIVCAGIFYWWMNRIFDNYLQRHLQRFAVGYEGTIPFGAHFMPAESARQISN